MDWEAIGAVGEVVGALGVVLTLAYLSIQVRQNTRGTRAATVQAIQSAMNDAHSAVRNDVGSARIYRLGLSAHPDLSEDETVQFQMFMYSVFAQFENIHYQFEQGTLDKDIFERHCRAMDYYMAAPGGVVWWNTWKDRFSPGFVRFLDSRRVQ